MFWKNSFQCGSTTENVETCNRRGWQKVELTLITATLSKCYPWEESGMCDWNYLSKLLDTFLRYFHTRELFRKSTSGGLWRRSGLHGVLKDACNCREVSTKRTGHSLLEMIPAWGLSMIYTSAAKSSWRDGGWTRGALGVRSPIELSVHWSKADP